MEMIAQGNRCFIYIQDAQVEQGLVATDYIETGAQAQRAGILEDMPRLDYSGGASCPSLLLEPSRTNLLPYSEYSDDFEQLTNVTINTNSEVSPEGLQNATTIVTDAVGSKKEFVPKFLSYTSGLDYTASCFVKANGYNFAIIKFATTGGAFGGEKVFFNLSTGQVATNSDNLDATIEAVGYDGWYRISATNQAIGTTSSGKVFYAIAEVDGVDSFTGDGTSGLDFYGFQQEQGSYPTSYIPTYGTSQTRSGDAASLTGASSIIGQTQGSFFVDFVWNGLSNNVSDNTIMSLGAQNYGVNSIAISNYNGSLYARVTNGISVDANIFALNLVAGTRYKCLVTYTDNEVKFYVNGVLEGTDTSVSIPVVSDVYLQNNHPNSKDINQSLVFTTILTDSECIALTTL